MTLQVKSYHALPYWRQITCATAFVIFLNLLQLIDKNYSSIFWIPYMVAPATLAFFAAINIRKHYKIRSENFRSYLLFFISMILIFLAEETWEIEERFLHQNPFPSIADGFYLAVYPFFILFLLRSLNPIRKLLSKKVVIFGGLLSISLLIPTVMSTYNFNSEEELLPFLLLLSYPTLDAIMFGIVVVGLLFAFSKLTNYYWVLILVGVALWIFADTAFLYAEITDTYYDGHPVDIIYIISYILWTFATIHDTKNARKQGSFHEPVLKESRITLSSISKFAVPLSWMITVFVSIYIMYLLNLFEFTQGVNEKTALVGLFFGTITALSVIILLVNKNLSKLVRIREIEIEETNAEMRKIEKLSAIGQITARFAHDMRNPLTAIKNSISLITYKQKLNEKINDADLENINRAIFRITHQTDDILDFLRDSEVVKSPNSLKNIISYGLSYIPQNPDVTINLPKNDAVVNCNSYQIERVFINLILNSMQAINNNGTITIRITEEKDFVRIEFEDTGPGVSDHNIARLFEPLFTTKQVGTGLGLTSCKKIISNHGGKISFKNNPTTFTITLPK